MPYSIDSTGYGQGIGTGADVIPPETDVAPMARTMPWGASAMDGALKSAPPSAPLPPSSPSSPMGASAPSPSSPSSPMGASAPSPYVRCRRCGSWLFSDGGPCAVCGFDGAASQREPDETDPDDGARKAPGDSPAAGPIGGAAAKALEGTAGKALSERRAPARALGGAKSGRAAAEAGIGVRVRWRGLEATVPLGDAGLSVGRDLASDVAVPDFACPSHCLEFSASGCGASIELLDEGADLSLDGQVVRSGDVLMPGEELDVYGARLSLVLLD